MGELNIYGVYVPILLIQAILAYLILRVLMRIADRFVDPDWVPMPNIFYLCVFVMLLWLVHWLFIVCQF
ncbi:DUF1656 domain-containing protein [Acinetobacter sp. ANC 5054]|uniref:DUF1656 domain-containing protein n=1 Tax=Acinetobacter sp. ANC 5054 TaxID=1977877 RepID=UPI000A34B070|nr:DUF1656 domain-containing protein [Acinetobacter sp. ANC 5054]OTG81480.1 DUF1656 domain-containing protein [Acinetobacter sp. ANC 5054]